MDKQNKKVNKDKLKKSKEAKKKVLENSKIVRK